MEPKKRLPHPRKTEIYPAWGADSSKRQRVGKFSDLEDALFNWFTQKRANNIIITDDLLREKAKKLGEQLDVPENFAYSNAANIYNADETGLFFQLIPDRTLAHKDENYHGVKRMKQRITALLCCNSTGTDKRRLLIIGKSANLDASETLVHTLLHLHI
ncbi:TIGD6 [Cordylochernes scorpioides]|uniref:TIGD6 n=1 Tax=Cordylochernes scorpioides TaxID=51811 RepID=A0ABY6L4X5_9ARAC|nr:TIGD6 [Cordylochernes scorpioides]